MKIFLSLQISGTDDYHDRAADLELNVARFFDAKKIYNPVYSHRPLMWHLRYIILILSGFSKFSPIIWKLYMSEAMRNLFLCDNIVMGMGWDQSKGCRIEYEAAKAAGIRIFYETNKGFKTYENNL